jgi:transposase InsO family protein
MASDLRCRHAEALRPRPKGRPRGSGPKAAPRTREQELEERVRRLEAQVAMELRAVDGARIADKTVLKMMSEMGLRCGIRRETDHHRYNSYGVVGEVFGNVLGRDFSADGPWQKMGTDVTEFKCSFGKAYLAPVYDFGSKEIVAWSISEGPGLAQQEEMLAMLMAAKPEGASPILHSDMGWL